MDKAAFMKGQTKLLPLEVYTKIKEMPNTVSNDVETSCQYIDTRVKRRKPRKKLNSAKLSSMKI